MENKEDITAREKIEELKNIFEAKLKSHNVSILKDVGLSTSVSAFEAMTEYASQQTASKDARISNLERDLKASESVCAQLTEHVECRSKDFDTALADLNDTKDVVYALQKQLESLNAENEVMSIKEVEYKAALFERKQIIEGLDSLCDELAGALKHIESVCDNTNESHEGIWRLAYNALSKYREARKEGKG